MSLVMPYYFSGTQQQQPKYTLFRGCRVGPCYAPSPFVTKVEFRIRIAGISYKIDSGAPWLGPKGKIPYLESSCLATDDAGKNTMLGDSTLIIRHLIEQEDVKDLNGKLDPSDKGRDLALRALLEDKLYFYHMRECWVDNYYAQRDQALSEVPFPVRFFVGQVVYKKVVRSLFGQGTGRYTKTEIEAFRNEIWYSINDMLISSRKRNDCASKDAPFWCLGGSGPTEADITLFSFISAIIGGKSSPSSSALLCTLPAVMEYADLIHKRYFPDYVQWQVDETVPATEIVTMLAKL